MYISPIFIYRIFGRMMDKDQLHLVTSQSSWMATAAGLNPAAVSRTQGHLEGVKRVEEIIRAARDMGIEVFDDLRFFRRRIGTGRQDEISMMHYAPSSLVLGQKAKALR